MAILLANNVTCLLPQPIQASDHTIVLASGDAALFPTPTGGNYFVLTIEDRRVVPNTREVLTCTARSGTNLTVTRAQEGTTAQAFFTGATVSMRLTAGVIAAVVAAETTRAEAAEATEAAARAAAISTEAAARAAGDATEATARANAITTEAAARTAADTTEAVARSAADTAEAINRDAAIAVSVAGLNSTIATEASNRATGDSLLGAQIAATNTALAAEVTRATAAEAALSTATAGSGGSNIQYFANGNIMQWGSSTTDGGGHVTVTFPVAFPSGCYNVQLTPIGAAGGAWIMLSSATPSNFAAVSTSPLVGGSWIGGPLGFHWFAVGR
jgi:hypothetical protein